MISNLVITKSKLFQGELVTVLLRKVLKKRSGIGKKDLYSRVCVCVPVLKCSFLYVGNLLRK